MIIRAATSLAIVVLACSSISVVSAAEGSNAAMRNKTKVK